jgi:hypothetical protein
MVTVVSCWPTTRRSRTGANPIAETERRYWPGATSVNAKRPSGLVVVERRSSITVTRASAIGAPAVSLTVPLTCGVATTVSGGTGKRSGAASDSAMSNARILPPSVRHLVRPGTSDYA